MGCEWDLRPREWRRHSKHRSLYFLPVYKSKMCYETERTHTERKTRLLLRVWDVLETSFMAWLVQDSTFGGLPPHTVPVIMPR